MALNFEYGINTGNRFVQFIDHEEDPDEFIAQQTQPEEKTKKSKDAKPTSASTKSSATKTSTSATTSSTSATGATTKSNKENVTGKASGNEQRKQQSVAFSDNQQQGGGRPESGRGAGRGGSYPRRGGSAGPDRGGRGGGYPRYNRPEGQQTGGFEQGVDSWTNEAGNDNQTFSGGRGRGRGNYEGGRGRGRGNYEGGRGNYEGGRGRGNYEGGRGRGRGRGFNNNNRPFTDSSQGGDQENSTWEQTAASNFDARAPSGAADSEIPISPQGQTFDSEQSGGRGGRGGFRSRTFRSNRNQGERSYHHERGGDQEQQVGQDEYRQNRRAHDRQQRNLISSVKPIEKKDGQGAHNWGDQTEVPEEEPVAAEENAEGTAAPAAGTNVKNWSQQVDEEEQKMMTFDEYKKQIEEKKKQTSEKLPQFNRRTAGEGEDPQAWKPPQEVYRKKNEDDGSDEDEEEGDSQGEEAGSEDEGDEQISGKKKIIQIPLHFKPIEVPRGPAGGRGGRRGGPRPPGDRPAPARDEQGQAPQQQQQQQQTTPSSQPTGDEERPQSGYRGGRGAGGSRGAGRGEYRRSYGNAARGSRGGQYSSAGKSGDATSKFDFGNTDEFPTLAK